MEPLTHLEGGCQCGAIRFRLDVAPLWVGPPAGSVTFTRGALQHYRSSAKARRGFCASCGTPIAWIPDTAEGETPAIELALATFDRPEALVPTKHAWCDSAMAWLPVDDHLPRYPRGAPEPAQ